MAQANVAREPSMEEILASIRKIIESNDPVEDQCEPSEGPNAEASDQPQSDTFRRPLSLLNSISEAAGEDEPAEQTGQSAEDDMSKEPTLHPGTPFFATPLRTGPADEESTDEKAEDTGIDDAAASGTAAEKPVSLARLAAELAEERAEHGFANVEAPNPVSSGVVVLPAANDRLDDREAPSAQEDNAEHSTERFGAERHVDERRALMSQDAGSRVATSFGNLNHAVSSGPARSFDEIAEDMLRPMLQEWLDDNLPTLVERLVREEIERVARGG